MYFLTQMFVFVFCTMLLSVCWLLTCPRPFYTLSMKMLLTLYMAFTTDVELVT